MPLREIEEKFTKSELVLMAWRSQEQHHQMKQRMKKYDLPETNIQGERKSGKKRKEYADGIGPEQAPDKYFNDEGEFDLSKVTGEEAVGYMQNVLRIPFGHLTKKVRPGFTS